MSKAAAYMKGDGVRDIVSDSTVTSETASILIEIYGILKDFAATIKNSFTWVSGNWQLLIVGAIAVLLIYRD